MGAYIIKYHIRI
jgi:hypothetical protein